MGGEIFRTCPDRSWGPPSLLYNGYWVFPAVKRPGRGIDHPPPSNTEVKERVQLYLYSPSGPSWPIIGWPLPLLLLLLLSSSSSSVITFMQGFMLHDAFSYIQYTDQQMHITKYNKPQHNSSYHHYMFLCTGVSSSGGLRKRTAEILCLYYTLTIWHLTATIWVVPHS